MNVLKVNRKKFLVLGLASLILLVVATTAIAGYMPEIFKIKQNKKNLTQNPNSNIELPEIREATSEEVKMAKEKVEKFVGKTDSNLKVEGIEKTPRDQMCLLTAGNDSFTVDMETEEVCMAYFGSASKRTTNKVNIPKQKAFEKAMEFINDHCVAFPIESMELTRQECVDRGSYKEYEFEWQDTGSPSYICIVISPTTGEIISYSALLRKGKVDTKPKVSKEEALDIAKNKVDFKVVKIKKVDLQVWYDSKGEQILRWNIELEGEPRKEKTGSGTVEIPQGAWITIDAHTGKVLNISKVL